MKNNSINMTLTDIPYGTVTRKTNGLERLLICNTLGSADQITFNELDFCKEVLRITKGIICIFCGKEQFSTIFNFFSNQKGTTRAIVWEKTNPVPSNGKYVYLSGIELAVWFKKSGYSTFNAFCKNTVFRYPIPSGNKRLHKTQKHWDLWKELILDNTNEGDIIFDPCAGSGVTAWTAIENNRNFICCELDKDIYNTSINYLKNHYK